MQGSSLKNEEHKEEASVSKGQAGKFAVDKGATKEIPLHTPVTTESVENGSSRVGHDRCGLETVSFVGENKKESQAPKQEDEEEQGEQEYARP